MANLNRVFLMGNLTRDPELRYTPSGTAVAQFGVATNRRWKDKQSGEMREEVTFVDVEVWGKQAELAGQYLAKGRPVFIEGRLRLDQWDDRNTGQKRSRLKVVGERFQFLGARGEGGRGPGGPGGPSGQAGAAPSARPAPARTGAEQPPAAPAEAPDAGADENFEASEDIPF
jgi:single-strand DNA-binding protein